MTGLSNVVTNGRIAVQRSKELGHPRVWHSRSVLEPARDVSHQYQHEQDDQHQPEPPAGGVAPVLAVSPSRKAAHQKNGNYNKQKQSYTTPPSWLHNHDRCHTVSGVRVHHHTGTCSEASCSALVSVGLIHVGGRVPPQVRAPVCSISLAFSVRVQRAALYRSCGIIYLALPDVLSPHTVLGVMTGFAARGMLPTKRSTQTSIPPRIACEAIPFTNESAVAAASPVVEMSS